MASIHTITVIEYISEVCIIILTLFVFELKTRVGVEGVIYHCLVVLLHLLCGHRDNHFRTRRTKYVPGVNFRQNPTTLKFYSGGGGIWVLALPRRACVRNDVENEPNNVSIVAIVLGEAWTLSNRC